MPAVPTHNANGQDTASCAVRHRKPAARLTTVIWTPSSVTILIKKPKKLFSVVKSKRDDCSGVAPLRHGGAVHNDAKVKAGILNEQFASVFSVEPAHPSAAPLEGNPIPDISPVMFSVPGITELGNT